MVRFRFDDIWKETNSKDNIIGKEGYCNVYTGFFPDCSEVALKRFKNCSAAGDTNFKLEARLLLALGMPILLLDEVKIVRLFKSTERFCANVAVKDVMPTRVDY